MFFHFSMHWMLAIDAYCRFEMFIEIGTRFWRQWRKAILVGWNRKKNNAKQQSFAIWFIHFDLSRKKSIFLYRSSNSSFKTAQYVLFNKQIRQRRQRKKNETNDEPNNRLSLRLISIAFYPFLHVCVSAGIYSTCAKDQYMYCDNISNERTLSRSGSVVK